MGDYNLSDFKARLNHKIKMMYSNREKFADYVVRKGDNLSISTLNSDCNPNDNKTMGIDRLAKYCQHLKVSADYLLFGSSYESWGNDKPSNEDVLKAIHVLFKAYGNWFVDGHIDFFGNRIMRDEFGRAFTTIEFVGNGINSFFHNYESFIGNVDAESLFSDIRNDMLNKIVDDALKEMEKDDIVTDLDGNVINLTEVEKDG